jgi:hypothetical protein
MKTVKYITNKELLAEIHRCKSSFCTFLTPDDANFDLIVNDLAEVTPKAIEDARTRKSARLTVKGEPSVEVPTHGLIIRMMTFDHIPLDADRKRKSRAVNQTHARCNFPPFKHFRLEVEPGTMKFAEVGRSHWSGDFETGCFSIEKGKVSNRLGHMFMLLVERYSRRANWRGYTYVDEMRGHALTQLSQIGLQFDESKSDNPFSFYTTVIRNCFLRVTNIEHKNQTIRDDLLIQSGAAPSYTRQIEHELSQRPEFKDPKPAPAKRGRKPAAVQAAMAKADDDAEHNGV